MILYRINYRIAFSVFATLFYLAGFAQSQSWNIPADKSARNSYIKFSSATVKQGEEIYLKNCTSCHGNPGKNNSLKSLKPIPPDLSSAGTQQRTDGDLFYIITVGRDIMPSFVNILSEEERWQLISYIRSFNKGYVQVISKFDPNKSKLVKVKLAYDSLARKVKIQVVANEKTGAVPLKNDEAVLSASRYFGKLQIGKAATTDANGEAVFDAPDKLPGDKNGNVELVVKITDENYGEIQSQQKLKIGVPTDRPPLTYNRSMWNKVTKAPVWLLFVYTFCLLIVLSCFGYIFYSIYRIQKSPQNK